MTPQEVFLETMRDLRHRTDLQASDYDITQASGLIRRLLLDGGSPLVHTINREHRLKLACEWGTLSVDTGYAWASMLWLDPELYKIRVSTLDLTNTEHEVLTPLGIGSLDKFLRTTVISDASNSVSAKGLITHYANREGGVHHSTTPTHDPLIRDVRHKSPDALSLTALACCRIVYQSLEPLAMMVKVSGDPHPIGIGAPLLDIPHLDDRG